MDELNDISPHLSSINRDQPFAVPEHYFEDFPERLRIKVNAKRKVPVPARQILVFKPYLAAAILMIIAIVSGTLIFRNHNGEHALPDMQTEISQIVEWELYSISEETILEVMNDGSYKDEEVYQDNSDEIIDYLLNEDIPVDELMNAL